MRLFKFASSFVKGLLLAAVLALMLAACGGAAPAPTQATSATPTQSTANPVQPTPQPSPTPTQIPIQTVPVSEASVLQQELARWSKEWPELFKSPADGMLPGLGGNVSLNKGDVVGVYMVEISDGKTYYLVSDGSQMGLVKPDAAEALFGPAIRNAPLLKGQEAKIMALMDRAKAWQAYRTYWKMPDHIDGLVDQNGNPVDLHKFFTDRNYAVRVVSYYLQNPHIRHDGKIIPFRRRTNKDPNRIVDALYALYDGMRSDPGVNLFGVTDGGFWFNSEMKILDDDVKVGNEWFYPPYLDDRGDVHSNIDTILDVSDPSNLVVYNPFTHVKVKEVWLIYYGKSRGKSLKEALEEGIVKAEIDFYLTPPDGKPVEFYITHTRADLDFPLFKELDVLNKAVYVSPGIYLVRVNGRTALKPGEPIAPLLDPSVDPLSQGWHIEFGPDFEIQDYRIATLMATAMLYHPHPEQYLPPLPSVAGQGHWLGKKHVVSYQPTVPAVAVKQPDGTVAFANINPYKKEPGWMAQLPKSARFSRYPKAAFRRRA